MNLSRRTLLKAVTPILGLPTISKRNTFPADVGLVVTGVKLHTVKVNQRGNWYFVEILTNKGISGVGEASHGFTAAQKGGETLLKEEIATCFKLIDGQKPSQIELYRQKGLQRAIAQGRIAVTAFSAIEQALWDVTGKSLGVPVYELLGGKLRDKLKVYANINRATNERDAQGRRLISSFQRNAELALQSGFKAIKLAPFDEMKPLAIATSSEIDADIDYAVKCIGAVRKTIGKEVDLLIDVHSHLNRELAIQTAKQLETDNLYWFEEAVDPQKKPTDTKAIKEAIGQPVAGGESISGRVGFVSLITNQALDIIMPDVKHCGGILECRQIATLAESFGNITVAPHNPSGPISTAASIQVCANIPNFSILEYAYGEVSWRNSLVNNAEQFENGYLHVPDKSGLGYTLNPSVLQEHS